MNNTTDEKTTVDLNSLIVRYVCKFPFPSDVKKHIDFDCLTKNDIDDKDLIIDQQAVEFVPAKHNFSIQHPRMLGPDGKDGHPVVPVYSCEFVNRTSCSQENNISISKETKSTTYISFQKTLVKEGSFSLTLAPPTPVLQASGAFKRSLTVDNKRELTTEETNQWGAETKVIVPPMKKVKATLVIDERQEQYNFTITTRLSGTLKITLKNKHTGWKMQYPLEINDLSQVFTSEFGFVKNPDLSVTFTARGSSTSKFGVSQRLVLQESDLSPSDV